MNIFIGIIIIASVVCAILTIIMMPFYIIRKKKYPDDRKNTIKNLIIKSFIAALIITLIQYSGLIAIYFDEMQGIYR